MDEFYMEETDDMENELDNFELYLDQELDYLDEEDERFEDEIWEEADEEDELTEAEEIELVKALTSIIDAAEANTEHLGVLGFSTPYFISEGIQGGTDNYE